MFPKSKKAMAFVKPEIYFKIKYKPQLANDLR